MAAIGLDFDAEGELTASRPHVLRAPDWEAHQVDVPNPTGLPQLLSWSPDGRILALLSDRVDLFSPDLRHLATSAPFPGVAGGVSFAAHLDWSPDGEGMAFVYNDHLVFVDRLGRTVLLSASALPAPATTLAIQPYVWLDDGRFVISTNWRVDDETFGRTFFAVRSAGGLATWAELSEADAFRSILGPLAEVSATIDAWPPQPERWRGRGLSADGSAAVATTDDRTPGANTRPPRIAVGVAKLGSATPTVFNIGEISLYPALFDVVVVP